MDFWTWCFGYVTGLVAGFFVFEANRRWRYDRREKEGRRWVIREIEKANR